MSDPSLGMQDFASIDPQTKDLVTKSFCIIQLHTFLMVGRASFLISHKIFLRCAKFSIWRRNDECGVELMVLGVDIRSLLSLTDTS